MPGRRSACGPASFLDAACPLRATGCRVSRSPEAASPNWTGGKILAGGIIPRLITQFVDRLAREGIHASGDHDDEQRLAVGHELVVAAIRAGDTASGVEAMREHMSLLVRLIPRGRTPAHGADARRPAARLSLADQSYHALKRAILAGEIAVGTSLTVREDLLEVGGALH